MIAPAWRRRGRAPRWSAVAAVAVAFAFAVGLAACGGDDGGAADAVSIGAGADEPAPAAVIARRPPGAEPRWAAALAAPTPAVPPPAAAAVSSFAESSGLRGPPRARPESVPSRGASPLLGDYAGRATVEIAYYDYCQTYDGNLGYAGTRTYDVAADVFLNPPAEDDGVRERSPFNLIAATEGGVEGAITVMSAQVVTDTRDGRSALFDYWDITERDGAIEGVLTDRWPGVAINTIQTSSLLVPCRPELGTLYSTDTIAEGATLAGRVGGDEIDLDLIGQSLDRERRFRVRLTADRG
jgi:hypothetical protein